MASSSKKKATKPKKEDKITAQLRGDLDTSSSLSNQYFDKTPLAHYADPFAVDQNNLLALRHTFADPTDPAYAGRASADSMYSLDRLRSQSDPGSASYVGKSAPEIEDIIARFKGGLEGYSAEENNALREQAVRGLNDQYNTQRRNLLVSQSHGGVRGAAATAQQTNLDRSRLAGQAAAEQDLFTKNVDEKRSRLNDYSNYVTANSDKNFARGQQAFGDFRDFQQGLEKTLYDRGQSAIGDYEKSLGGAQGNAFTIGQYNIGQDEKTQSRDVANTMGLLGLFNARRNEAEQNKIIGVKP